MFKRAVLALAVLGAGYGLLRRLLGLRGREAHRTQTEEEYLRAGTRVLILGGGFGGVTTALALDRLLGDRLDRGITVLVVDQDNSMLVTPLL